MMVAGITISSDFVVDVGRLSIMHKWVMPTLNPAKPSGLISLVLAQDLTRAQGRLVLTLGQTPNDPFLGLLIVGI